jgi:formylglycine-generating enzyme required for sulfatase activity
MYDGIVYKDASSIKKFEWYYGNSVKHTEANGYAGGDGFQHGHPVGRLLPNPWGLYDMLGNVDEMCLDAYNKSLGTAEVTDPILASGSGRVRRGANINSSLASVRGTLRSKLTGTNSSDYKIGYRLMCPITLKFPVKEDVGE